MNASRAVLESAGACCSEIMDGVQQILSFSSCLYFCPATANILVGRCKSTGSVSFVPNHVRLGKLLTDFQERNNAGTAFYLQQQGPKKAIPPSTMSQPDYLLSLKFTPTPAESGILAEHNNLRSPAERRNSRDWLLHISASSRRRAEQLLLKQRKEKMRRRRMVRRREYQRLRNMVPSIAAKPLVSKVTVIEEAIRYIDYLHSALLTRLRTKGLPNCLRGVDVDVNHLNLDDIKELVCQLVQRNNQRKKQQRQAAPKTGRTPPADSPRRPLASPVSFFERSRHVPSYLTARRPLPKRT